MQNALFLLLALLTTDANALRMPTRSPLHSSVSRRAADTAMLVELERTVGKGPSVRIVRKKKEITALDEAGVLAKWSAVQAVVDTCSLSLLSALSGRDPVDLLLDPQLKFLLIGPAVLSFGAIGTRFHYPDIEGFETDPIVIFLGGPDLVRSVRDKARAALTVSGRAMFGEPNPDFVPPRPTQYSNPRVPITKIIR